MKRFLKNYITTKIQKTQVRPYVTNNIYSAIEKQILLEQEVDKIVGTQKKITLSAEKPLTPRQRKRIADAVKRQKCRVKLQCRRRTISYKEMRPDGICIVKDNYFTKTIQFYDINYQLARKRGQKYNL